MLSEFTWSDYLLMMGGLLIAYYLTITFLYYRKEARELLSGKQGKKPRKVVTWKREETTHEVDDAFDELESLVEDIRRGILEKAGKQVSKEALLEKLKERLADYGGLHRPAYRVALNNFILQNAKELCGIVFSEEELDAAWDELSR